MTTLEGSIKNVFVGDRADTLESSIRHTIYFQLDGIEDDKHRGVTRPADSRVKDIPKGTPIPNTRMYSAVDEDGLRTIEKKFGVPKIFASWLGANFEVSGVARFSLLPQGTVFRFSQGTELLVDTENMPCEGPGKVIASKYPHNNIKANLFQRSAVHNRGVVGTVITPGPISMGDTFEIEVFNPTFFSVPNSS